VGEVRRLVDLLTRVAEPPEDVVDEGLEELLDAFRAEVLHEQQELETLQLLFQFERETDMVLFLGLKGWQDQLLRDEVFPLALPCDHQLQGGSLVARVLQLFLERLDGRRKGIDLQLGLKGLQHVQGESPGGLVRHGGFLSDLHQSGKLQHGGLLEFQVRALLVLENERHKDLLAQDSIHQLLVSEVVPQSQPARFMCENLGLLQLRQGELLLLHRALAVRELELAKAVDWQQVELLE